MIQANTMAETPVAASPPQEDPRVRFAAERTLLAWMRTGLALMGFGFVVARFGLFLREIAATGQVSVHHRSTGWSLWIGTALIALGVAVSLLASWEYFRFVQLAKQGPELHASDNAAGRCRLRDPRPPGNCHGRVPDCAGDLNCGCPQDGHQRIRDTADHGGSATAGLLNTNAVSRRLSASSAHICRGWPVAARTEFHRRPSGWIVCAARRRRRWARG